MQSKTRFWVTGGLVSAATLLASAVEPVQKIVDAGKAVGAVTLGDLAGLLPFAFVVGLWWILAREFRRLNHWVDVLSTGLRAEILALQEDQVEPLRDTFQLQVDKLRDYVDTVATRVSEPTIKEVERRLAPLKDSLDIARGQEIPRLAQSLGEVMERLEM
ncbi:MAG: hypothetical protein L0216_13970 [Planctomycetales bacterium]|nr:hypothetical protein [Planctomycetales bacterium]